MDPQPANSTESISTMSTPNDKWQNKLLHLWIANSIWWNYCRVYIITVQTNIKDTHTKLNESILFLPDEDLFVLHLFLLDEADPQDDPGEVPQVEDVVRLGRGGQQVVHGLLVHLQRSAHNLSAHGEEVGRVLLTLYKWEEEENSITLEYASSLSNMICHVKEEEQMLNSVTLNNNLHYYFLFNYSPVTKKMLWLLKLAWRDKTKCI